MKASHTGVFLTSSRPAATARFYLDVAGLDLEQVGGDGGYSYWKTEEHGVQLAIHDAEKFAAYAHPPHPHSNLTHLYFKVPSQKEFIERLRKLNIEPYATDEVVVTVVDPDGRKVMFGTA